MIKITVNLNIKKIKDIIKRMPLEDKVKLIRDLEKETWNKRVNQILNNIDSRRHKNKISRLEISQEIEKARQEYYARHH